MTNPFGHIILFGAGSIGCYVGGRLAAAHGHVTLIGRPRVGEAIARYGLHLSDAAASPVDLPGDRVRFATDPTAVADADVVIVTVKALATEEVARTLAPLLKPDAIVLSLQNGVSNAEVLARHIPAPRVIAGMVPFNVVALGSGRFHRATGGDLMAAHDPRLQALLPLFDRAGLPLRLQTDMRAVLWGKLMLNLNNAINALSGRPLLEQLNERSYRLCMAACIAEGLKALAAAGIAPAKIGAVPARALPQLLRLPTPLYKIIAKRNLRIDPKARSSMWEDFEQGRLTEIDVLNGEVVRLAAQYGMTAPINARIVDLVHAAERGGKRDWSSSELRRELGV